MKLLFALLPCFWRRCKFSTLQQSVRFDFDFLELERFANPKTPQPNLPKETRDNMEELRKIVDKLSKHSSPKHRLLNRKY